MLAVRLIDRLGFSLLVPSNTMLKTENMYPQLLETLSCLKIEMTSFDIAALLYELSQMIKDARIENIYQVNRETLLLRLHRPSQPTLHLLVESGKRVHITSYALKKPSMPPAFCMALRKHLRNGKVQAVEQHEFERSITFKILTRNGLYLLVAELFGEGNIVLVDSRNVIVAARKYRKMRDRNILRNEPFKQAPPSGKNPFCVTRVQFDRLRDFGELEVVRALTKFLSIGGLYAEELLLRADVDKNTACQVLTQLQLDNIYVALANLLSCLSEGKFDPAVIIDSEGEILDVVPIRLRRYEGTESKPYKTFNEALDEYYTRTIQLRRVSQAQKEQQVELARLQRVLQNQQKTLEDSKKAVEQHKRVGDSLYAHFGELQQLLQLIMDEKQAGKSWEQIVNKLNELKQAKQRPAVYFDSLNPRNMILNVTVESDSFGINVRKSIQLNAAEYYRMMKKAARKLAGAEIALRETLGKIEELQHLWGRRRAEVGREAPLKRKRKAWFEKFRWFRASDGFLVVAGKDSVTNEILVKKYTEAHDVVFHADIVGAPFVVVKTEGRVPSEQVIQESAQFAASFSRAWREMFSAVDVYWIHPEQISKSPPPGQFVEKGAFIIRGTKNYVRKVPLRVGVGLEMKEELLGVTCGPSRRVSGQADIFVEIVPGEKEGKELVKEIRKALIEKAPKEWKERILAVPNDEFRSCVPFGRAQVILK